MSGALPRWATTGTGDSRRRHGDWTCSSANRQSMPSRSHTDPWVLAPRQADHAQRGAGIARRLDQTLGIDELAVGGRVGIGECEPQAMHRAPPRLDDVERPSTTPVIKLCRRNRRSHLQRSFDLRCRQLLPLQHTVRQPQSGHWQAHRPHPRIQITARQPGPRERGVSRREAKCLWPRRRRRQLKPRSCVTSRKASCRSSRSVSITGWAHAWSSATTIASSVGSRSTTYGGRWPTARRSSIPRWAGTRRAT